MLHLSSCTHLTRISRTYQTIARIVTALVVWFGFLLMFLNRPPAAPCRQWRRAYFNTLTLKKQDKNINSPKKLQAAEHLRTQRPEKLSKKPGTTPGEAFTSRTYYTHPLPVVNTNSTSNIKNSTSKSPAGAVHLPAGASTRKENLLSLTQTGAWLPGTQTHEPDPAGWSRTP